jgi:hypothetical protein
MQAGVDGGGRVAPGELLGVPPVRGAPPVVEQAGRAERERARADAYHPGPAGVRPAQRLEHLGRRIDVGIVRPERDEVGVLDRREVVAGRDRKPAWVRTSSPSAEHTAKW